MHSETIGRYYIESYPREEHDPPRFGFLIPGCKGCVDWDLAGEVQIMYAGPETGIHHGFGGMQIRAGAVKHNGYIFESPVERLGIIKTGNPEIDAQFCRLAFEFDRIPPGKDRPETVF
jgi:hypothetical protein